MPSHAVAGAPPLDAARLHMQFQVLLTAQNLGCLLHLAHHTNIWQLSDM